MPLPSASFGTTEYFFRANKNLLHITLLLIAALLVNSCGLLTEVPENSDQEPEDFKAFLANSSARNDYDDLVYFLASHDVHEIVPIWQLLQQGTDWRNHGLSKFAVPPRETWNSMVNTLVFLKYDLVPYIGPVEVLSGFRTPTYNRVAGGARKSRHMSFSALDLKPVDDINRSRLHEILKNRWENFGDTYNLGLGLYSGRRFHIDTGGYRQW